MKSFLIDFFEGVLTVGFNPNMPASNDVIIKDAQELIKELKPKIIGTKVLKVTGPASLPIAFMLAHELSHVVGAIACFDPKLNKFVVAVSHCELIVGDLI